MTWDGQERRNSDPILQAIFDLKTEVTDRLARIETKQELKDGRCDAHSRNIADVQDRSTAIERAIDYKPEDPNPIKDKVRALEGQAARRSLNYVWVYSWLVTVSGGCAALWMLLYDHVSKHPEVLRELTDAVKKMKGGG